MLVDFQKPNASRKAVLTDVYCSIDMAVSRLDMDCRERCVSCNIRRLHGPAEGRSVAVFRISKARHASAHPVRPDMDPAFDGAALGKYCATDEWSGDLSNGLFQVGKLSEQLHGLATGECGLLTLLRCYEEADRIRILELLEGASAAASSFCFSTHIVTGPGEVQPVVCIGHSTGFSTELDGRMNGIFIFPRMPVEALGH